MKRRKHSIGLALGGGGARGFAHIPVLEVFDELDVKPAHIVGTSIGAIVGALYASGHSAASLVDMVEQLIMPRNARFKDILKTKESFKLINLIDLHFSLKPQGLIKGEKLLEYLYEQMGVSTFEELPIPLTVVATDFWARRPVIFDSGPLLPAVRASMAIPYVFTPVLSDDHHILVDGGLVNNVPHDLIDPACSLRIAVDIAGSVSAAPDRVPSFTEAMLHTYQVMMDAMAQEKRKHHPVDIYVRPPLEDIELLDFHKAHAIYEQGLTAKPAFKQEFESALAKRRPRRRSRR